MVVGVAFDAHALDLGALLEPPYGLAHQPASRLGGCRLAGLQRDDRRARNLLAGGCCRRGGCQRWSRGRPLGLGTAIVVDEAIHVFGAVATDAEAARVGRAVVAVEDAVLVVVRVGAAIVVDE